MIVNLIYIVLVQRTFTQDVLIFYNNKDNYTEYTDITSPCDINKCSQNQGNCYAKYTCRCISDYISYNLKMQSPGPDENNKLCTYKQIHNSLVAIMEILVPTLGHFYSARYIYASIKGAFTIVPLILTLIHARYPENHKKILLVSLFLLCCVIFVWQIVDFIIFQSGGFSDGNGAPFDTR